MAYHSTKALNEHFGTFEASLNNILRIKRIKPSDSLDPVFNWIFFRCTQHRYKRLSVHPLYKRQSIHLSVHLLVYPLVHPSVHLSIYSSIHLSICNAFTKAKKSWWKSMQSSHEDTSLAYLALMRLNMKKRVKRERERKSERKGTGKW